MGLSSGKKFLLIAIICSASIILLCVFVFVPMALKTYNNIVNTNIDYEEWTPQTDDNITPVLYGSVLDFGDRRLDLNSDKKFDGVLEEVVCINADRVYFVYSISSSDSSSQYVWHIASVNLYGENFCELYSSGFVSVGSDLVDDDYCCLSGVSDYKNKNGGFYSNNCIYLKDNNKTVAYNVLTGTVNENAEIKDRKYKWVINNHSSIIFNDSENKKERQINLQKMAENNRYAKQLFDLPVKSTWNKASPVADLFDSVRMIGDDIYIITSVLNFHGEATAVVFKYDFLNDKVLYVSSSQISDRVESNYYFVPVA